MKLIMYFRYVYARNESRRGGELEIQRRQRGFCSISQQRVYYKEDGKGL